jgi:membrane protein involved in D-alanine export
VTPYDSFTYFTFLLYPLAIAVILGLVRLLGTRAILVLSVVVLGFQFSNPLGDAAAQRAGLQQLQFLAADAFGSMVIILAFARLRRRGRRQPPFYVAVSLALLPLVAVKVYPVLAVHGWLWRFGIFAAPFGSSTGIASTSDVYATFGFLGISYLTFRVIDAIITIQDGLVKDAPTARGIAAYLLFFPTISAGPIDRYRRFSDELKRAPRSRVAYLTDIEAGIHRIAQGFLYKFIVASLIYQHALLPASTMHGWAGDVRYMYAYSFYLFFDFAGYSAFAIGVARFLGIAVPENFNKPFLSRDFREMWNRWHMSLSFWLRDHVYMRFLLLATRRKWFGGNRNSANYAALVVTFFLMGCWHGLYWHYLVYGLYQGGMMVGYDLVGRWNRRRKVLALGWRTDIVGWVLTFNLFCFGLLIFSGHLFV